MRAVNDFIVVEVSPLGTRKTEGGLELSEALDDESRFRKGTIIDPGVSDMISKGDEVLYDKMAGNGSPDLPERCKVMRLRDIAVVL